MKYILALDQGTTSSRAIVFDKNGQMVARFTEEELQRIRAVYSALFLKHTDTSYIVLGLESYSNYDQDGDLIIDKPTSWTTINDNFVNLSLLDRYVDYEAGSETDAIYNYSYHYFTFNTVT